MPSFLRNKKKVAGGARRPAEFRERSDVMPCSLRSKGFCFYEVRLISRRLFKKKCKVNFGVRDSRAATKKGTDIGASAI